MRERVMVRFPGENNANIRWETANTRLGRREYRLVGQFYAARIVHIGSNPNSSLAPLTDIFVRIPVHTRLALPGELDSQQIMTSLFEQALFLLGDAVALMIAERRKLVLKDLWQHHENLE